MDVSRWIGWNDAQGSRIRQIMRRWGFAAVVSGTLLLCGFLAVSPIEASLIIRQGNTPVTISFDESQDGVNEGTFAGGGFSSDPIAGQLNSNAWSLSGIGGGLSFGGVAESGVLARGTSPGGVTAVGIYAFDVGGNWILGIQPGGSDFTPGSITLRLRNEIGQFVTQWDLSYDIYYYNDQLRGNRLDFSYAANEEPFTSVSDLDFVTPADRDRPARWESVSRRVLLEQSVGQGEYLYLRWSGNDALGSGSRDEYGLDNIRITALLVEAPPRTPSAVPEPASFAQFGILAVLATLNAFYRNRPILRTPLSHFGTGRLKLRQRYRFTSRLV